MLPIDKFFQQEQPWLLTLANDRTARPLLGIADDLPEIVTIQPHSVTARISSRQLVTVFRAGPTHARRGYYFQKELRDITRFLERQWFVRQQREYDRIAKLYGLKHFVPVAGAATTIIFPDPDGAPGATTSDSRVQRSGFDATFGVVHDATGNGGSSADAISFMQIRASATLDQYERIIRHQYLFDYSSIAPTDILVSATLALVAVNKTNDLLGQDSANSAIVVCESVPGSDTGVVPSDYQAMLSVDFGRSGNQASISLGVYTNITLNALGRGQIDFSTGSIARLGGRYGWDIDNLVPHDTGATWSASGSMAYEIVMSDTGGVPPTIQDPRLTLVHDEAPPPPPPLEPHPEYGQGRAAIGDPSVYGATIVRS